MEFENDESYKLCEQYMDAPMRDIMIFSNDVSIQLTARKVARELKLSIDVATCKEQLFMALPSCMIVDPINFTPDFIEIYESIIECENSKRHGLIIFSRNKIPAKIKKFVTISNSAVFEEHLRTKMVSIKHHREVTRNHTGNYTKKLNRLFCILRKLQLEGAYIKLDEIMVEFGVSEKTIKRDISFLKEEGEEIVYDIQKGGYVLRDSYSSNINVRNK